MKDISMYVKVTGEGAVNLWNGYRIAWNAYLNEGHRIAKSYGASSWWQGFGGGFGAFAFDDTPSSDVPNIFRKSRRGTQYIVRSRGTSAKMKEEIAQFLETEKAFRNLMPNAEEMAAQAGFPHSIETVSENISTGAKTTTQATMGNPFEPVQPLWAGSNGQIFLRVPDVKATIEHLKSWENGVSRYVSSDLDDWTIPRGYERSTKDHWDLELARFKVAQQEEKLKEASNGAV